MHYYIDHGSAPCVHLNSLALVPYMCVCVCVYVYVLSVALDCVIYVSLMMMMMQDFSFVMREYRLFFVKLPNGLMCREIFNITKPISELREKLCDHIGAGRFLIGSKT